MAVVILAVGPSPHIGEAVRSVLGQAGVAEVVVVESGNSVFVEVGVRTVRVEQTISPGAARNTGIAATSAPFVAFLAADCIAAPDWAESRMAVHRAGFAAVGSALVPDNTSSLVALASHLSRFYRRLPAVSAAMALPYGASYRRDLFDRYGLFREDLRTGEDSEFNRRLPNDERPVWAPDVVTIHRSPDRLTALLQDQRNRGERYALALLQLTGQRRGRVLVGVVKGTLLTIRWSVSWAKREDRLSVLLASPLIILANLAFGYGVLTGQR